jgi:hypothetical protein
MAPTGGFSDEFLGLSPEERRERIRSVGLTDRSAMSPGDRDALDQAVQEMTARWAGRLPQPEVVDRRSSDKAS